MNKMFAFFSLHPDVPDALIAELIEHSAEEVVKKLPKKRQEEYRCGFIK